MSHVARPIPATRPWPTEPHERDAVIGAADDEVSSQSRGTPNGAERAAAPPGSFQEFERLLSAIADRTSHSSDNDMGAAWVGQRAASMARHAGACDHLIAAAFVHDFASHFDGHGPDDGVNSRSAHLLEAVFPEQVLEPVRWLDREAPSHPPSTRSARHALSQGRRLRAYVDAAQSCSDDAVLSWQALLKIARRASLDG